MNLCQTESCFVCNGDVDAKGVLLTMEMTSYSKTAFPTKLMELLGESFMMVILEDDKICYRCANLINRTDKLERDLNQIKSIIMGFLNEKYDLNREEELSLNTEEPQDPKDNNVHDKQHLVHSPTINAKHVDDERYQTINLKDIEEFVESNAIGENVFDVGIKSEPAINSDQNLNSNSSYNTSENCIDSISRASMQKSPQQDLIENHSTLECSRSEINQTLEETKGSVVAREVKEENLSANYSLNCTHISLPFTNNFHFNKSDAVPNYEHMDENKPKIEFCENSTYVKYIKDISSTEIVPCIESSKDVIEQKPGIELSNIVVQSKSREESKRQTLPLKLPKQNNCKRAKKEKKPNTVKKLRPILPKVSDLKEVLSSLSNVQNSNFDVNNDVLNYHPKFNQSSITLTSDTEVSSKIKSLNSEMKSISNQSHSDKARTAGSVGDTPLAVNFNTYCKICNMCFTDSKSYEIHEKKHQKDDKLFMCSFCVKTFKNKVSVVKHEAEHVGKYLHCCEFCGRGFNKMDKLEDHRRKHTKEARYICDVCGKKFQFHATYWIHRKWHDNPFPYKCNECGKPFKHSSQLSVHRRKHTGERPYKCSYCSQTFNVTNTLKRHLVLHTKEYPYKCRMCDQGFATRYKYTEHLARKHDIFVEKSITDPRDYKMVVSDNTREETRVESLSTGTAKVMDFGESNCNIESLESSDIIFHTNPSDCRIEIILPSSSVFSDNSLPDFSWLT